MPFYKPSLDSILTGRDADAHRRTCEKLLALRQAFRGELRDDSGSALEHLAIPPKEDGHCLLATWNLRELGGGTYGGRSEEAMLYIAEILSRFDLVAVQEVRQSLSELNQLQRILGDAWQYVVTDLVPYRTGGNQERLAYLYDSRSVRFRGLAGELSLEPEKLPDGSYYAYKFARDPYVVGFRSGWFRFCLVTVHILWGEGAAEYRPRVKEIEAVAGAVRRRADSRHAWSDHHILLGDFNIFQPEDATFRALVDQGFYIPPALQEKPSNLPQTKHYDQIAFMTPSLGRLIDRDLVECDTFDFLSVVYRDGEHDLYAREVDEHLDGRTREETFEKWRTYQMSDHLPMWIRLRTDHAEEYLREYRLGMRADAELPAEDP